MSHNLVRGVVILARNGDRQEYYQDPINYEPFKTENTPLGAAQSHQLGAYLRSVYLNQRSPSHIHDIRSELVDNDQIHVRAKAGGEGQAVFDSAVALLQGLFPPTLKNSITLANGTTVTAPLGGYQYVPIETVEPENDRSLEPWTQCPAFEKHVNEVMRSDAFRKHRDAAKPFLDSVKDYVFGPKTEFDNMWNVYEYIHSQYTHNRTYAFRLPPTYMEQARHHVNAHQAAIFSDENPLGIGNVAGRTILPSILNSLSRIAFNDDPLRLSLHEVTYPSLMSLLYMTGIIDAHPELKGLPNFASALAIELRRSNRPDSRDYLRFKFKNGTADGDFRVIHPLGHEEDIPLTEFIYRVERYQISNNQQWHAVCNGGSVGEIATLGEDAESNLDLALTGGMLAFVLLAALFVVARIRKTFLGRIRLDNTEAGTTY